jgi:predicted RNA binding protein YcfA (HicA-like mRNA interferase family)
MKRQELRRRVAQHRKSVSFDELRHLLEAYGWELDRVRGSHHVFKCGSQTLTVPHRRPHVLPVYVREVLALTAGLDDKPTEGGGDDDDGEPED